MCSSCPPARENLCYMCGANHGLALGNTLPAPATGTLSVLPEEIIGGHILSFDPDSARVLQAVSRTLKRITEDFLRWNAGEIVTLCARADSPLYGLVYNHFISFSLRHWFRPDLGSLEFHLSIPESIRSLGIGREDCPDKILNVGEIARFNDEIQPIQDVSLEMVWERLRRQIVEANPPFEGLPETDASAQVIRAWMGADANQPALQVITRLDLSRLLGLTCVPWEIRLCTGLQELNLSETWLTVLPEDAFHGLGRLQSLNLVGAHLVSLSAGSFQGLVGLQRLSLRGNELGSLPEELFRGLTRLQMLDLSLNKLTVFPGGIFQGLAGLQTLNLEENQLASLPGSLLHGLDGLQSLRLHLNRLESLPEEVFHGLVALEYLSLGNNRLMSLPEGVFQGLAGLQRLFLDNNQLVFLPAGSFQGLIGLRELNLTRNQLVSLPEGLFHGLDALRNFNLQGNPQLLFFHNTLPENENNIACPGVIDAFFSYRCKSPLAGFYQFAAGSSSSDAVEEAFSRLPDTVKNAIYGMVWIEAGRPDTQGAAQWEENHAFDDILIVYGALKKHAMGRMESMTGEQQNAVYRQHDLSQREGGTQGRAFNFPHWGKLHVPMLIDAMEELFPAGSASTQSGVL